MTIPSTVLYQRSFIGDNVIIKVRGTETIGSDIVGTASSGRRVTARNSRAGEEDWTKRKKQNRTSKAEEEAEECECGRRRRAKEKRNDYKRGLEL
ncbi:uncharacterized protein LOC124951056 [Vespa velutina]|uniref:uncharacterized protein LOC124951056 n=1 Tax=Vespa velutina TaxID=202808 RepID=UPI001FB27191|nr:uncharacterized protein LOC124951056 [Vespa velutina]